MYEAYQRFLDPPAVASLGMLGVGAIGLLVNLAGMRVLRPSSKDSLNLKGAYFEVLSDMLSSVGVITAGVIILTTGWAYADPLFSAAIGLFILPRTWTLLTTAVGVLLEGTPATINLSSVREAIAKVPGVAGVHDLHVWSLTSGVSAMSVPAVLAADARYDEVPAACSRKSPRSSRSATPRYKSSLRDTKSRNRISESRCARSRSTILAIPSHL